MNKISIGFSKHNGSILSSIICYLQNTKYSHVYIRRNSKYGEYVYQASGLQVNFTNIDIFLEHNTIIEEYEFEIPEDKHDKLLSFCIKYAGRPYGAKALMEMGIKLIINKFSLDLKFNGDKNQTFVCSELGALFCEQILEIDISENQDFITPKQLNTYVSLYGKRII